jgi:hypothetical protein
MSTIRIDNIKEDGNVIYTVMIDASKRSGILNFTTEILLNIKMEHDECKIISGWEINCGGDYSWESGEEDEFEFHHPGVLQEVANTIINQNKE